MSSVTKIGYRVVEAVAADGTKRRVLTRVVRVEADGARETLQSRPELAENVSVDEDRPVANFNADTRCLSVEIAQQNLFIYLFIYYAPEGSTT